jgi:1-acyl-sn-glycerol-3-phosphate acyltransferase
MSCPVSWLRPIFVMIPAIMIGTAGLGVFEANAFLGCGIICPVSWLRSVFVTIPAIVIGTAGLGVFEAISWLVAPGKWQGRLSQTWCRMVLRVSGIRVRALGMDKLNPERPYVFAANHTSYMDTPALLTVLPGEVRFFAYAGLLRVPFFGAHLRRAGHLAVDEASPRKSLANLREGARLAGERGISVALFPEGSRSRHGLAEFREGAAYVAIKAGVPLVPVGIVGMGELMPAGSLCIRRGRAEVRIGDPIDTAGLTAADRARLTQEARAAVARLISAQSDLQLVQVGADRQAML